VNLSQLRYLITTADTGTMTAAADELHVAQPVVSRSLRALERELGVELLRRAGRGVELTPLGVQAVAAARRALDEISTIELLSAHAGPDSRPLLVAATPTLEGLLTRRLMPALFAARPDVRVRVLRAPSRDDIVAMVLDGRAELGLTDLPVPDALDVVEVTAEEVVLVSPAGSTLSDPVPIRELDGLRLILPSRGTHRRDEYEALFRHTEVTPVVALETDERSSWMAAAIAGIGSFLWYRSAASDADAEGIEMRSFDPPLGRTVGLVSVPHRLTPAARLLLELAPDAALRP
jgi:DNA-binding transcriptional LysR family regulator